MSSLEEINRKIEEVAKEIEKVAKKIGKVETAITTWENNSATKTNDYDFWKTEKKQLQTDKNNLQTEKNNLQAKENKLRDEMLLLLQRQSEPGSADGVQAILNIKAMTSPKKFKELLANSSMKIRNIDEKVWCRLKQYFMNQIVWTETSDEALKLYELAKYIPSTDTLKNVEHTLKIHLNGALTSFDSETPVIKALSQDGIPLVAKFFIQEELAKFEADIGLKLKNSGCNGFVVPEFVGKVNHHFVLKMPIYPICLQEFTIHHRIDKRPLTPDLILQFAGEIKDSLDHMHKLGIFHCDIKPGNILISANSNVLICDLGSVTKIEGPLKSSYNLPRDLSKSGASKKIDYTLLATTVLEMLGCDVSMKMLSDIHEYVKNVSNTDVKTFLEKLLE